MKDGAVLRVAAGITARFRKHRGGNVAVTFALALVPLMVAAGGAIDFTRAMGLKDELQNATDSAALGVARDGLGLADTQLPKTAAGYMAANFISPATYQVDGATLDRGTMTATVDTSASIPTVFLKMVGLPNLTFSAHSVAKGLGFEIALVLDTSGSMNDSSGSGGSKISALKSAANSLLDTLYGTTTVSNRFSMAVVPFAAGVNVGSGYSTASWMDTSATPVNAYHAEDFDAPVNRFTQFANMKTSWKGCVMSRPYPYDTDDTAPTGGNTQFVPWFAPDEPGEPGAVNSNGTNSLGFYNSYLNDDDGSCKTGLTTKLITLLAGQTNAQKQARTCKYKGSTPKVSDNPVGSSYGPNFLCDSQPITPLTNVRATLNTAISNLDAEGNTDILEGVTWGWRVLSPSEPFTQGKAYGAPANRKVIILMTDGQNTMTGLSGNMNFSLYSAYGYALYGHAGGISSNSATLTSLMNTRTATACSNIKAKGVTVYTIAFGADAAASQTLLQNCASSPAYFYAPQNSSDLKPVFISIAQSINALRIAQ